jgi:hypothetical protein
MNERSVKKRQEASSQWAGTAGELIDKFVNKNMSMAYEFDNLTVDIPNAHGPGGDHIGSVKWIINGKVTVAIETYDKSKG